MRVSMGLKSLRESSKSSPQGLKPDICPIVFGTTKVVP
jgi:hypothetical protein